MAKVTAVEKVNAVEMLKDALADANNKIFIKIESVSKSGMSRKMVVYTFCQYEGELYAKPITRLVARACDLPYVHGCRDTVRINGCGMDMVYHLAETIGYATGVKVKHESI